MLSKISSSFTSSSESDDSRYVSSEVNFAAAWRISSTFLWRSFPMDVGFTWSFCWLFFCWTVGVGGPELQADGAFPGFLLRGTLEKLDVSLFWPLCARPLPRPKKDGRASIPSNCSFSLLFPYSLEKVLINTPCFFVHSFWVERLDRHVTRNKATPNLSVVKETKWRRKVGCTFSV